MRALLSAALLLSACGGDDSRDCSYAFSETTFVDGQPLTHEGLTTWQCSDNRVCGVRAPPALDADFRVVADEQLCVRLTSAERAACTVREGDDPTDLEAALACLRIPANVNTQIGERERSGATLSMCHELGLESSFRREGPFSTMR